MKKDYHIHTKISEDCKLPAEELIAKAIEKGYTTIAFTDHLEMLFPKWSFHPDMTFSKYIAYFASLKDKYSTQIEILTGVEIGEYHVTIPQVKDYFGDLKPDLIIGSIHTLLPDTNISIPLEQALTPQEIIKYYKANLELVEKCDIDILGHLGIFTRYLKHDITHALPICRDIFQVMVAKNIVLEINYSGLRKTTQQFMPHFEVLEEYAKQGGKRVSIGSDTHVISDFDDNYDRVIEILEEKELLHEFSLI